RSFLSPSPVLRDTHAEEARIDQKYVCRQAAVVTVQERAGDSRGIEYVLEVTHHLPAILACQDESEVDVGVTAYPVVRIIIEHACPGIVLPVIIDVDGAGPIRRQWHGVICGRRYRKTRGIGQFVAAQIF